MISLVFQHAFCQICCKPCLRICPRVFARYKARLKARPSYRRSDNFILISAKYIQEIYHSMRMHLLERLLGDDFLRSIVASIVLFAIGIKLIRELDAWQLTKLI